MSEIKGILSVKSVLSALGFFFGFFCLFLHALSVRRSGYPLRLSLIHVIEIASGLCAEEEHGMAHLNLFVMIAFFLQCVDGVS